MLIRKAPACENTILYWQASATFKPQTQKALQVFKNSRKTLRANHNDFSIYNKNKLEF